MNLLFYAPQMAAYGGLERHVCGLAAAAARAGHQVTLLTTSNSLGADLRGELVGAGVTLRELSRARGEAGAFTKLAWLLAQTLRARTQHWDVIYTNGQSALARHVWRAAGRATRIIHHHHTAADAAEQATWSPAFRRVLRSAPELIGCSQATCAALNAATGRGDAQYLPYLTRCPVRAEAVTATACRAPLRLGFMGRLIPEKGIDTVVRLAGEAGLAGVEWHIHGEGPAYPPEFFQDRPRLVYHGAYRTAAEQAAALLALDGLTLFSTHNEGMPLSLLEGMAAGLPLLATDRGGTRELAVSPADTFLLSDPADFAAIVAGVQAFAAAIRSGQTSRPRQRAAYDRHFAPASVAGRWLDLFSRAT
jgi:glycosyltransferase involved in cell wall biosynthesis